MTKVKICGLTKLEDVVRACEYGADLVGFIFLKNTTRYVGHDKSVILALSGRAKGTVGKVGIFKDENLSDIVKEVLYCGLDYVQLVGNESPDYCAALKEQTQIKIIKAFKVADKILDSGGYSLEDYTDIDYFVFDTFHPFLKGGTGEKFDWGILGENKEDIKRPFFIAGGLTPANVKDAVRAVRPYGVDVSSGIETSPGEKDYKLLKEFIENAKEA